MSLIEIVLWGVAGGIGAELAVFFGLRHTHPDDFPHWARSKVYYAIAVLMAAFGGLIVLAHARSGTDLSALLAIQVGASTPLFLRKIRETVPPTQTTPDPDRVN